MTAGLLQTQFQNNFRFKSLFSKTSFFIQTPTFILISAFHTWNDKLYRHRRGKVYINKSQSTQSLPAYQRFKGELDIKHAKRFIFKTKTDTFEWWQSMRSATRCYYSETVRAPKHRNLWLLPLTNNCNRRIQSSGMKKKNVTVWFPVRAELNKNETQISNCPLKNKQKKHILLYKAPCPYTHLHI